MPATWMLALATTAFVGSHYAMSHPLRTGLVARLGDRGFLLVYSLVAFGTLGAIIWSWRAIEQAAPAWIAPLAWWSVASALMLVACILLAGSLIGNPALPHPGAAPRVIAAPRGVFAITRHPMNWSIAIWALVHLSLSGSVRNIIVASAMLVLALAGSVGQDRKKEKLIGEAWRDYERRTSFLPFAGLLTGRVEWRALVPAWKAALAGLILWAAVTSFHAPLVSPIGDALRFP